MTHSAPPRRSDSTRAAILHAARERFATDGYERATIRAIAADAGIDPAMVMRYYGNKEKLFAAAAEFDLDLPDLTAIPHARLGAELVGHFLRRWERDDALVALLRAAVTNTAAAERMQQIFAGQLAPQVALVCPDPAEAATRATLVAAQMLGFALCRYVLRLAPARHLPADDVTGWLGPTVQRYLTQPAPRGR
ncbi:MAG TPA: TetR family transcriptional regulator [Rugosimonospora sp.]|nr:TetR family transcriptional regulator [Rugosimonospora sp.]